MTFCGTPENSAPRCRLLADDRRTAAHLALAEGKLEAALALYEYGADFSATDRWGNTPLDEGKKHPEVLRVLEALVSIPPELRPKANGGGGPAGVLRRNAGVAPQPPVSAFVLSARENARRASVSAQDGAAGAGGGSAAGSAANGAPWWEGGGVGRSPMKPSSSLGQLSAVLLAPVHEHHEGDGEGDEGRGGGREERAAGGE